MKKLFLNTKDTTYKELLKVAEKCDFVVFSGGKHDKIKTYDGKTVTTIPRHNRIKRETAKGIIERMKEFGAEIDFI